MAEFSAIDALGAHSDDFKSVDDNNVIRCKLRLEPRESVTAPEANPIQASQQRNVEMVGEIQRDRKSVQKGPARMLSLAARRWQASRQVVASCNASPEIHRSNEQSLTSDLI